MGENSNQRKTITGASAAYRYANRAGLISFISFLLPLFVMVLIMAFSLVCLDYTRSMCNSRSDVDARMLKIFLPIHFIFSLLALFVAAPMVRGLYIFLYDRAGLLKGGALFLVWLLIPAYIFYSGDASPYHIVSTGAYLLLIILYYCVGYFAFRGKTASTSL